MSVVEVAQTTTKATSSSGSGFVLQRKCACGGSPSFSGECEECKRKKLLGKPLQKKLAISQPGDEFEQEADRVAEQVMRMPDADLNRQHRDIGTPLVQRRATSSDSGVMEAPPIVHEVLASPGQPLDSATRAFFEPRFGHNFGRVRVYTDGRADTATVAVGARAFTAGHDIVFGRAQWSPETASGRRLLAHELAHVYQEASSSTARRDTIYRQPDEEQIKAEIQMLQMQLMMPVNPHAPMQQVRLIQLQAMLKPTGGGGKPSQPKPLLDLPFTVRFSKAWDQAKEAALQKVLKVDKDYLGSSITRGLIEVRDLLPSPRDVWKTGVYGGLFKNDEKGLVDAQSAEMASQTYGKRYKAAKYGHIYGDERYYESSGKRRDDDTEIWSRGRTYGLFLPSEKAAVLNISAIGIGRAAALNSLAKATDPKSPDAAKLMDEIHNFTKDPAVVLLGPEMERIFGPFGYTYRDHEDRWIAADEIDKAYKKSLKAGQVLQDPNASVADRWDECQRRRNLGKNNLEGAAFDPVCFKSEDEFQQELVRRAQEFRTRYQGCSHSRPSHFKCRDEVAAEYFPAGQARQDAIRHWAYGQLEIYEDVVKGGVVSQTGFHFAHDVLEWSTERSAAFGGALSTGTSLGLGYARRRALLQKPPSNPPPPPMATTRVVGKPDRMPKPDAPVVKGAPDAPVKPSPVGVKPPPASTRDPVQKTLPPPDTRQFSIEVEQAQERYNRRREKASQAEKEYAKSLRNTARARERRGQQLTQQESDLLATKRKLEQARDDALSKLNQAKQKLGALQPSEGATKHGQAGLAQEPKYVDELRGRGLRAELTGKNTPVIDAAIVGIPEVYSVKSIVPSEGSNVAVRLAENGSPHDLADRVSKHITKALVDRRSDKWSRLRNRWNNTMRARHADQFGYDLPKNPDDITFVVDVRVVTAKAPSVTAQQEVEAAVTAWLKKNERVPPRFTWRIIYVSNQ